ncbi:MAG: patatin-like phospholipase family protein [Deltaproteobacteria bacterium]|nr:patatin-like phospholipase family protein [Deltaproteobacteria bacterium]
MAVTFVQKSDLNLQKKNAKMALVLAGGAIAGGAYTLAGLKTLNTLMVNKDITDSIFSSGCPRARSSPRRWRTASPWRNCSRASTGARRVFRSSNRSTFTIRTSPSSCPSRCNFFFDMATMAPRFSVRFLSAMFNPEHAYLPAIGAFLRRPTWRNADNLIKVILRMTAASTKMPSPLSYLPGGLFDNRRIERYIRENLDRNGRKNDFAELYFRRRKELYITALNLDTAERTVFGHDEDASLTISEAVQASTSLPGFFKPARIKGQDYLDGGITTTANIDVAVNHGADLIIVYNPFRPFHNRLLVRFYKDLGTYVADKPHLADGGVLSVLNQAFRALLHYRLHHALARYQQDPSFKGDIILIEPDIYDVSFFDINPVNYWERAKAAERGFVSVKESLEEHFPDVKKILGSYGIETTMLFVDEDCKKLQSTAHDETVISILGKERIKRDIRLAM